MHLEKKKSQVQWLSFNPSAQRWWIPGVWSKPMKDSESKKQICIPSTLISLKKHKQTSIQQQQQQTITQETLGTMGGGPFTAAYIDCHIIKLPS